MRNVAILLTLVALVACEFQRRPAGRPTAPAPAQPSTREEAPDFFAGMDFMGTTASRAERAPYSPVGWPLQREDLVSPYAWRELDVKFQGWLELSAPFWIGKTVFGARWIAVGGAPDLLGLNHKYIGHFAQKTYWHDWSLHLPDHLHEMSQTKEGFEEIAKSLFDPGAGDDYYHRIEEMKGIWTRQAWLDGYTGEDGGE